MPLFKDKQLPHPGNPKGEPNLGEREYETGTDEQAKQSAMNKLSEAVVSLARDNDRSSDHYESLRIHNLYNDLKRQSLDLAEREMALTERRNRETEREMAQKNREFTTHCANLQFIELDPKEAKSVSEVLSGVQIEAVKTILVATLKELGMFPDK